MLIHITTRQGRRLALHPPELRMNRCLPIWSDSASFKILSRSGGADPRPLEQDMMGGRTIVSIGRHDPLTLVSAWRAFEAAFDIPSLPVERIQILVAAPTILRGVGYDTHRRAEACTFRADEEASWERELKVKGVILPKREGTMEHARTNNAVGFWILPHTLFVDKPTQSLDREGERILDLTNVKPQLGLFEMSEE